MHGILFLFLMLFAFTVDAATYLPLTCLVTPSKNQKGDGSPENSANAICGTENMACVPGKNGLYTATPSGVWTLWENLKDTDSIRAWANDLTPGSCSGSRVTIPKSQAVTQLNETVITPTTFTWALPTTYTNGERLTPSDPITKVTLIYSIDYTIPDNASPQDGFSFVDLAGTATSYKVNITSRQEAFIYARAKVTLQSGVSSALSVEVTKQVPSKPKDPMHPDGITINIP